MISSQKLAFKTEDETTLVARARVDPQAFGQLYERYLDRVYRYMVSHVGEPADAEDLTAQVFAAAWEGLARYQERGEFSAWLFRIARNKATDYHRNRRVHLSWEAERALTGTSRRDAGDPSTGLERAEDLARLSGLIDRLEANQVELLRLRFAAELTHAEIASLLGRSEVAIKMALGRLLRQLQAEWEAGNE